MADETSVDPLWPEGVGTQHGRVIFDAPTEGGQVPVSVAPNRAEWRTVEGVGQEYVKKSGDTMTGRLLANGGISFGGAVAGSPTDSSKHLSFSHEQDVAGGSTDFSKGVHLYDGNDELGINVSSTTMNFVAKNGGDKFDFWTGGAHRGRIDSTGIVVPTGQKLTIEGQASDDRYVLRSEGSSGDFLPSAGGPISGYIDFTTDNSGLHFYGDGAIYKRAGLGMILQKSSGGQQWMVENADGTGGVAIATLNDIPVIPEPIDAYTKAESDAKYQPLPDNSLTQAVADTLYLPVDTVIPPAYVPPADAPNDGKQYGRQSLGWTEIAPAVAPPSASSATLGDVKSGFQTADHAGWVILDGRAITALTATQQTAATSLGFTANLPDALNAVPLQNMGVMGTVSGSNERVLTQANLPAIDLTTDEQGLHRHTMRSVENDNGKQNLQNLFMGKYDTDEQLWNGGMDGATINNGNYAQIGAAMEGAGAHTHTVSLGGSATPIDITPKSLAVNMFLYLGA